MFTWVEEVVTQDAVVQKMYVEVKMDSEELG